MYARIVNVQLQPAKVDEGSRIVKESIVPAMKNQKGFKGQLFFTQPDTGKAISINLWETEDDMTSFEKALFIGSC
jgi:heme-degrading monooxygenase HmoA